jgi:dTDP-4-amino-4,6-dideoxygalactose transaminase
MSKLALLGGSPAINRPLELYKSIGIEEEKAVAEVMKSGCLSGFLGRWCDEFNGGPVVQKFEKSWAQKFGVKHAISVNSNTSGLIAAVGAVGVGPGDEVIVPPWSMSATAMAPIFYGGIPVFADIEDEYFCLDVQSVIENITSKTKAIIVVNLFGHPAELKQLRILADKHGIKLIEDNAQAPLATEDGVMAGSIGHIGVFSLNYHKHIHTGEGGVCITDDDELAMRLKMIRNHGENVVDAVGMNNIDNIVGYNFRMTEMSAAIGICQLDKIENLVDGRIALSKKLSEAIKGLPGIIPPAVRNGCSHAYYLWAARFDENTVGVSRDVFAKALEAEGCPVSTGYAEPLYLLPMFQRRIAIGSQGYPFSLTDRQYAGGLCPVTERLYYKELLEFEICSYQLADKDMDYVINAFHKVYENKDDLAGI